jgi:hypothetical protein
MKNTRRKKIDLIAAAIATLMLAVAAEAQTSGTPGKIAKFKSTTTLGDSVITEDKLVAERSML